MEAFQALGFLVLFLHEQSLQLLDGGSLAGVDFEHAGEDSLKARRAREGGFRVEHFSNEALLVLGLVGKFSLDDLVERDAERPDVALVGVMIGN